MKSVNRTIAMIVINEAISIERLKIDDCSNASKEPFFVAVADRTVTAIMTPHPQALDVSIKISCGDDLLLTVYFDYARPRPFLEKITPNTVTFFMSRAFREACAALEQPKPLGYDVR